MLHPGSIVKTSCQPPARPALRQLWASQCEVCREWTSSRLCPSCREVGQDLPRCPRCALPAESNTPCCLACLEDPPPWDRVVCAVPYAFPWNQLISAFKYHEQVDLSAPLAEVMAGALLKTYPRGFEVDQIIPMPLASERLAERGFNQAWELARRVARQLGLHAQVQLLQRPLAAAPQAHLSRKERLSQLQGAFVVPPAALPRLRGQRVALVDDVLTTGATARAAAVTLRHAGVSRIELWTLARTDAP